MSNKNTKNTYYSPKWISCRLDNVIDSTVDSIKCFCVDPTSNFTRSLSSLLKPLLNSFLGCRLILYQVKFLIILLLPILIFHQYLLFLNVVICYILKFLNLSTEDFFLLLIICLHWMVTISLHRMVLILTCLLAWWYSNFLRSRFYCLPISSECLIWLYQSCILGIKNWSSNQKKWKKRTDWFYQSPQLSWEFDYYSWQRLWKL